MGAQRVQLRVEDLLCAVVQPKGVAGVHDTCIQAGLST